MGSLGRRVPPPLLPWGAPRCDVALQRWPRTSLGSASRWRWLLLPLLRWVGGSGGPAPLQQEGKEPARVGRGPARVPPPLQPTLGLSCRRRKARMTVTSWSSTSGAWGNCCCSWPVSCGRRGVATGPAPMADILARPSSLYSRAGGTATGAAPCRGGCRRWVPATARPPDPLSGALRGSPLSPPDPDPDGQSRVPQRSDEGTAAGGGSGACRGRELQAGERSSPPQMRDAQSRGKEALAEPVRSSESPSLSPLVPPLRAAVPRWGAVPTAVATKGMFRRGVVRAGEPTPAG